MVLEGLLSAFIDPNGVLAATFAVLRVVPPEPLLLLLLLL